jgi:hypothetical protein
MLQYACDNGFKYFDFGRSTFGSGTYKFKKQWGAEPIPLYWYYVSLNGGNIGEPIIENSTFQKAAQIWKKLPVTVTKIVGPRIRKFIGL